MAEEVRQENTPDTNNGGDPTQPVSPQGEKGVSTPEGVQAEKTFTQKELDDIVKQRVERAKKGMPSADELKAFHEWQDSQKTAEQRTNDLINEAKNAQSAAEKRAEAAEAKYTALSLKVRPDAVDDVITLAMSKVSDDTDIESAIKAVIKKHPHFAEQEEDKPSSGIPRYTGPAGSGTVVSSSDDAIRALMGIK